MGEFQKHEPCPKCPSSDGFARYADGGGHCFVCEYHEQGDRSRVVAPRSAEEAVKPFTSIEGNYYPLTKRCIEEDTCRAFRYRLGEFHGEPCQIMDYFTPGGQLCGQKIRTETQKGLWVGDAKAAGFFGQHRASLAMGFRVYVTEGEIDALSVSQVKGNRWPVVSLKNGASGARKEFAQQLDWLDQFREVVLCFDADEPGMKAAQQCAELLPHKTKIAHLPLKDANEMLVAGQVRSLIEAIDGAAPFRPAGIVQAMDLIDRIVQKPERGLSYPWPCLDKLTHGMRLGEIWTWCAGTGVGKSQILREVTRHLLIEHGQKVGVIALEEATHHTALCQVSLELNKPLHIPAVRDTVTEEEIRLAAKRVLPNLCLYSEDAALTAEAIMPKIRYMVHALGVKWIVLDHLSIMVSGMATDGDERKRLDELMTKLRWYTQELGIGLHIICHLRKPNGTPFEEGGQVSLVDLRGSGAIAQISNGVIAAERHQQADDAAERHITRLRVLKNRFSGDSGEAGKLQYDPTTGRLSEYLAVPTEVAGSEGEKVSDF